jgi:hypothetical protein
MGGAYTRHRDRSVSGKTDWYLFARMALPSRPHGSTSRSEMTLTKRFVAPFASAALASA